jgi:hypothetical protein
MLPIHSKVRKGGKEVGYTLTHTHTHHHHHHTHTHITRPVHVTRTTYMEKLREALARRPYLSLERVLNVHCRGAFSGISSRFFFAYIFRRASSGSLAATAFLYSVTGR